MKKFRKYKIFIQIVTGPGYRGFTHLEKIVSQTSGVSLTHATGVISSMMESADIAITSNGRTVYELAHMNIPGIVIPQHEREETHSFAQEQNGFIKMEPRPRLLISKPGNPDGNPTNKSKSHT